MRQAEEPLQLCALLIAEQEADVAYARKRPVQKMYHISNNVKKIEQHTLERFLILYSEKNKNIYTFYVSKVIFLNWIQLLN